MPYLIAGRFPVAAVLFDLGDTLLRYHTPDWQAQRAAGLRRLHRALTAQGQALPPEAAFLEAGRVAFRRETPDHRVLPLAERLAALLAPLGVPVDAAQVAAWQAIFFADVLARLAPDPDAAPLLAALRARGVPVAVVSNCPWGSAGAFWQAAAARHGLAAGVDAWVFCGDVAYRKPHPAPFRAALARLGAAPAAALFVGDSADDIAGAQAAGLRAVWIDRGAQPLPDDLHPDLTIRSLHELYE